MRPGADIEVNYLGGGNVLSAATGSAYPRAVLAGCETTMSLTNTGCPREIERKFLLKRLPERLTSYPHEEIDQGYLAVARGGVQVRLRKKGSVRTLTYKRGTTAAREEREVRLSKEQFDALWPATEGRRLTKIRYDVAWEGFVIEVDVYTGRHDGVVVAEVEFADEKTCRDFIPPDWVGEDVSGKSRYSNVVMAHE
ncbi:MAG: CYTH domain-containing protein [Chthoniobacterales bacterium]